MLKVSRQHTSTNQLCHVETDEYPEIIKVWESSVRATHDFLSEEDIQFFKPLILNEYLKAVDLRCIKNADGEILGFVGVAEKNIEMLFVAAEARGTGVGGLLLRHAIDELQAVKVDVNEQNPQAVGFYERHGFYIVGRSPVDGMGKPFPLLHMELSSNR
ncbi:Histone acetyltransferase HPA2/related acetyltransferase [Hahella chejuensis KCTC 2396]|uniref:Histone acetyltransferase HPA2/related acetyltransferase n=1 Tax=Hahella chejuensis (strain KCTC 2396) TaxID=349521 RepID=Q2SCT8_HAHCH|nr:GNAT family N-acetyltransferase [Hahella chejuensis]ABC31536.1 Histone acetyltransferase HPA2/related acetyltransferase [Hahella chejuensis KCTC 2396]